MESVLVLWPLLLYFSPVTGSPWLSCAALPTWALTLVARPDLTWSVLAGHLPCACHTFPTGQPLHPGLFNDSSKTGQTCPSF